jgi:hypothetical protein
MSDKQEYAEGLRNLRRRLAQLRREAFAPPYEFPPLPEERPPEQGEPPHHS